MEELADTEGELHGMASAEQVAQSAWVAAVDAPRRCSAQRATCSRDRGSEDSDHLFVCEAGIFEYQSGSIG